ncbi:fimbrial protein, partial [Escherichia coli]|nr:fimbrial protein [Escherichia coli]MDZ8400469.1 fimbrial protein [Escherichia coli]
MKTARTYLPGYALLAGLLLTASTGALAVDNNLHFYGNLLSKSCTLVVDGANLAEIHFPTVSNRDLMVAGQSAHLPVVFKLKDCKGPAGYNVKVTLSGTEDSGQPGFLAVDDTSTAQGVGIGMETLDGTRV